ncbi:MAG: hypothetical protein V8R64_08400 [Thomasclavelia sp.]
MNTFIVNVSIIVCNMILYKKKRNKLVILIWLRIALSVIAQNYFFVFSCFHREKLKDEENNLIDKLINKTVEIVIEKESKI